MSQTKAPNPTPTPQSTTPVKGEPDKSPGKVFVTMALDMSWRLAIVVVIPIVAGFKLDEKYSTEPFLTIAGFLLAISGIVVVLRRMLQETSQIPIPKKENK